MNPKIIFTILLCVFVSCSSNSFKKNYENLKSKVVVIPHYTNIIMQGRDTVDGDIYQGKLKLIVFKDSTSCSSCSIATINKWKPLIEYAKKYDNQLCYYFIYTPSKNNIDVVRTSMKMTHFHYPIILDSAGEFRRLNPHLPKNKMLHTFLLDENNNVVMIGNPLDNIKTEKLFKTTVNKLLNQ